MILYIEEDLVTIGSVDQEYEFDDTILKDYSIDYKFKQLDNKVELTLFAQKICLSEVNMNTLFDCFINVFDYTMRYGGYGGEGCEFSISIKNKEK